MLVVFYSNIYLSIFHFSLLTLVSAKVILTLCGVIGNTVSYKLKMQVQALPKRNIRKVRCWLVGGRPRKSTASLQGTITKEQMKERLEVENQLKGNCDNIEAPEFIKLDEVALAKFEDLVRELKAVDVISNVDVDLLAIYCDSWSKYVKATKLLMMQSLVEEQENKSGCITKVQNPYIKIQQSYAQQMVKLSSLFGLSPADRSRIAHLAPSDKNEKADPLMELLSGLKSG